MRINTPRSVVAPESPWSPAGNEADETLQLAFDADASFFNLLGEDEQLLGLEADGDSLDTKGMDGSWDLEELKGGAVWKGKGRKSEVEFEAAVEEQEEE